jgi:TatD DNase family protein
MIDTHCHLDMCADPDGAVDPQLAALVTVGINVERNARALELASRHDTVWAAVGLHPNSAAEAASANVRDAITLQAQQARVVAIGETGFDTHWQDATPAEQRYSFDWQAELARELGKPLILHVRDAQGTDDASQAAIAALRANGYGHGILHCCNGHQELLATGLELGWSVSFAGNVTFPKAALLHEAARIVPDDRLLVETDSPYLAPVPQRGKRNTPAFVRYTAAFLAQLRNQEPVDLEALTDANAIRVFNLPLSGSAQAGGVK